MTSSLKSERRLAAIVAADIVGYSASMALDEAATLGWRSEIHSVIAEAVGKRGGRIFALAGDGFLMEFASPADAVRSAYSVQLELARRRHEEPGFPQLRIGVHLADVVSEGDDLLGDGVNVAARIEAVCEPGAVTVSQQILDQVKRTAQLAFNDIGERSLKNLPEPVRLYSVAGELAGHSYGASQKPRVDRNRSGARDRSSILVMPFANLSGDASQDYFADGFSEDLVIELARFKGLVVIARNATFALRGTKTDPVEAATGLGATHCVVGSLRRLGERVRVAVQLLRVAGGEAIWAEKFDFTMDEIFDVQDRIVTRVASALVGKVESDAVQSAKRKPPADLGAYDCLLRGLEYHRLGGTTQEDAEKAVEWFDRAVELDPYYGRAHAWRACAISTLGEWTGVPWVEECLAGATKALELDENEAEVHRIMGSIKIYAGEMEKALVHFKRGLETNPSNAYIVAKTAEVHNCVGEPEVALALIARAKEIDPFLPDTCLEEEPRSCYLLGRYREALELIALVERPTRKALAYAVACAQRLGDAALRERALERLMRVDPQFTVASFLQSAHFKDAEVRVRLESDLLQAGAPA